MLKSKQRNQGCHFGRYFVLKSFYKITETVLIISFVAKKKLDIRQFIMTKNPEI